jgi:hypothetical protein
MLGTGNAAQYQAFVSNFARTSESIYLNFDLDAPAARANFRGGYLVTFACGSRGTPASKWNVPAVARPQHRVVDFPAYRSPKQY